MIPYAAPKRPASVPKLEVTISAVLADIGCALFFADAVIRFSRKSQACPTVPSKIILSGFSVEIIFASPIPIRSAAWLRISAAVRLPVLAKSKIVFAVISPYLT